LVGLLVDIFFKVVMVVVVVVGNIAVDNTNKIQLNGQCTRENCKS
jgi:hypothetical protein